MKRAIPRSSKSKVRPRESLARALRRLPRSKKVVFTNGVFDLLHPGHVDYLERARKLGDLLVVALNSDDSVRRLGKGPGRPVNPLSSRMAVLAGLECVDYVTSFGEDTPLETILLLRPKLVVKGGDWKVGEIVGGREAKEWGGGARSLPFLKGHSTTSVVKTILHQD